MNISKYKAILFDYDDTLANTKGVKMQQHKFVGKSVYNIDIPDELINSNWGKPFHQFLKSLYGDIDTVENIAKNYLSHDHLYYKDAHEGSHEVINDLLEKGYKVGILTSMDAAFVKKEMTRLVFPVDKLFAIQGEEHTSVHKPDPKVFDPMLEELKKVGIDKSECLYIGDSMTDYYAARDAGIDFLGVTTGLRTKEEFEAEGAKVLDNLMDLIK